MPPARLDDVKDALADVGIPGMTLTEVRSLDRGSRRALVYRGLPYVVDFALKMKAEMVVRDDEVPEILEALEKASWIGEADDVSVFVFDVVQAVRIRTGERGEGAIDPPTARVVELAAARALAGASRGA